MSAHAGTARIRAQCPPTSGAAQFSCGTTAPARNAGPGQAGSGAGRRPTRPRPPRSMPACCSSSTSRHTARNWAAYAHSGDAKAARRTRPPHAARPRRARGAEHRAGSLDLASRYYQQLVTALSAVDGPDGDRTLAAKADAAGVDHARGRCAQARHRWPTSSRRTSSCTARRTRSASA